MPEISGSFCQLSTPAILHNTNGLRPYVLTVSSSIICLELSGGAKP
ncbi:MAG: hypothetical protein IJ576_01480 [Synergistaceae bacterium]|nr:hypothetical protein [Synergistaceae bacterium]